MRKKIVLVMVVFFCSVVGGSLLSTHFAVETPEPSQQDMIAQTMRSVVHITAEAEEEQWSYDEYGYGEPYSSWQGSGSYIGNGLILTAGHVVEGAIKFTVTFESGLVLESEKFYKEPTMDVGFILIGDHGDTLVGAPLEFDFRELERGDLTYIFGHPLGWDNNFSVSKGVVSSLGKDHDWFFGDKLMFNSDAASYPGNSGGVVVDEDGEIIGILVGGYTGGYDNLSLCVPADIVHLSMEKYLLQLEFEEMD